MNPELESRLIRAARAARRRAHCPYSGFAVGAAVVGYDGRIYAGANIENASYGLTVCAERVAVFRAVAAGARKVSYLAVVADTAGVPAPCGACRQVLAEFAADFNLPVLLANLKGHVHRTILAELFPLPFTFGPHGL